MALDFAVIVLQGSSLIMERIGSFQTFRITEGVPVGYYFDLSLVPPGLPTQDQARFEFDDRSITYDCTNGSLWFRIVEEASQSHVGHATFALGDGVIICDSIDIRCDHRRKGIATSIYDLIERLFEIAIKPSDVQTDCAKEFWKSRQSETISGGSCSEEPSLGRLPASQSKKHKA